MVLTSTLQNKKKLNKVIKVYTPPGIGDALFSLQKIYPYYKTHFDEIDLYTWSRGNYSAPFLTDMHGIKQILQFNTPFKNYQDFCKLSDEKYKLYEKMTPEEFFNQDEIYLEVNRKLESGIRIDDILPNLKTTDYFPWKYNFDNYSEALSNLNINNNVVLYTSSINHNKISTNELGKWNPERWLLLVTRLKQEFKDVNINIIGSKIDEDLALYIKQTHSDVKIHINKPATFILPLFYLSQAFISYQSGMSCISQYIKAPATYMLYFNIYPNLRYSFCPKTLLNNEKQYKPVLFKELNDSSDDIINWCKNHLISI